MPKFSRAASSALVVSRFTPVLSRLFFFALYLLPAALFFSYHPVISLGASSSMNFELSLALIWLILFDLISFFTLLSLAQTPRFPGITDRKFFILSLLPFYLTLSIFWSANPLRGLLTAGIVWLLFFALFTIISLPPLLSSQYPRYRSFRSTLTSSIILSAALICCVCWLQSLFDVFGATRDHTLLCAGCSYTTFGFPHPSGFAIEPQFMGNLLLAPALFALYLLIFRRSSYTKPQFRVLLALAGLISTTLFITFSRGAIYAYALALFVMLCLALRSRLSFRSLRILILLPVLTFLLSLLAQGTFSALSPTSDTFLSGITKSLHQLSLGLVDLRPLAEVPAASSSSSSSAPDSTSAPSSAPESSAFSGYVAESTNVRLDLNRSALSTWSASPRTVFFGVGLGGAGVAMHAHDPTAVPSPKEIVQNQYFSLLLEGGLLGILVILFVAFYLLAPYLSRLRSRAQPSSASAPASRSTSPFILLLPLCVAYLASLGFFSGLPNALQIYLMPPLLYIVLKSPSPLEILPSRPKHQKSAKKSL